MDNRRAIPSPYLKLAFLRSAKAVTPSLLISESRIGAARAREYNSDWCVAMSRPVNAAFFVAFSTSIGYSAIRWAKASTVDINSDGGTTLVTRPKRRASSAWKTSPLSSMCSAGPKPIRRMSGSGGLGIPRRISKQPNWAFSEAMRMSQARALSSPPATA